MLTDVVLRPLTDEEFLGYRTQFIADWAADLARVDRLSLPAAMALAAARTDASLPLGVSTPGHHVNAICDDGVRVGVLWFSVETTIAFLDDLTILEPFRRRGYGRQALALFEAAARARGVSRLDLHVYRDNPGAIALYERAGYATSGLKMRKFL